MPRQTGTFAGTRMNGQPIITCRAPNSLAAKRVVHSVPSLHILPPRLW